MIMMTNMIIEVFIMSVKMIVIMAIMIMMIMIIAISDSNRYRL